MSLYQTGVDITVVDNASSKLGKITSEMEGVAAAADKVNSAFEGGSGDYADRLKAAASELRKLYEDQSKEKTQQSRDERTANKVIPFVAGTAARAPGLVAQAGGDAMGAAMGGVKAAGDVTSEIGAMAGLKSLGIAGAAIGAVAGFGAGYNALVGQYEKRMGTAMSLAAVLGDLTDNAAKNSQAFATSMTFASDTARKFGYSMEEGATVMKGVMTAGGNRGMVGADASQIMLYARTLGLDMNQSAALVGRARRFGQNGDVLGMAYGGIQASGMEEARIGDYMSGMKTLFEDSLSRGVVKGFAEISGTQNWFSQLGELYKGEEGAGRITRLNQATAGATSLARPSDVILYQAAQAAGGSGKSYIDTMIAMEGGISKDIFMNAGDILKRTTGGDKVSMIESMKEMFGTGYSEASQLYGLYSKGDYSGAAAYIKDNNINVGDTPEIRLLNVQNKIANDVALIGKNLMEGKIKVLTVVEGGVEHLSEVVTSREYTSEKARELLGSDAPIAAQWGGKMLEGQLAWISLFIKDQEKYKAIVDTVYTNLENTGNAIAKFGGKIASALSFLAAPFKKLGIFSKEE